MASSRSKTPWANPGDMLAIHYDGEKAIWGRVVYHEPRGAKKGRGLYMTVLDRDVAPGDDLHEVMAAPLLLGPLHAGNELVKEGAWTVVGNVPPTEAEQVLPTFEDRIGMLDYFFERAPDTPENRARMIQERIVSPEVVVNVVRAARGLEEWFPGYERYRAKKG